MEKVYRNLRQKLLASLVCLQFVDVFHQDALVFEDVTLCPQVQTVVPVGRRDNLILSQRHIPENRTSILHSHLHVPVNFLGLPVATEKTPQDSHAPHPGQLLWHTSIGCTLPLT